MKTKTEINREAFALALSQYYRPRFEAGDFPALVRKGWLPAPYAWRVVEHLSNGTALVESPGIMSACKTLGVPNKAAAIRSYLND